ncbi:MAG: hypothetical protein ACR2P6_08725 [Gammaproteobacteria bacterium]
MGKLYGAMSALACVLLLSTSAPAYAANYPLYVRYIPYSPPNLHLRTSRATTAYYVSITPGTTWNFDLDPVLAGTLSLAEGPIPVTIGAYRVPANCSGAKTVTVTVQYNIGGAFTTIASETQVINVPGGGAIVSLFAFNNLAATSSYVLQAGDYVRLSVSSATNRLCLVNEFPTGGTDADASRAVLQTGPILSVTKTSALIADPINGATNPKNIPGATVRFTVLVENDSAASAGADNVVVSDPIPANATYTAGTMTLDTGSGPTALTDAADADAGQFNGTDILVTPGIIPSGSTATVTFDITID